MQIVGRRTANTSQWFVGVAAILLASCSGDSSDSASSDSAGSEVAAVTSSQQDPTASTVPASSGSTAAATDPATSPPSDETATTQAGPDAAAVAQSRATLAAATMDSAGADAIEAVRSTDAGVTAAAEVIADGGTGAELWAATWVYTSGATDPAPLLPLLAVDEPNTRLLAAAGALSLGESSAAPVLVELLAADVPLAASSPPLTIGQFAAYTLTRYIDAPEIPVDAAPADLVAPWTDWLAGPGSAMAFDPETGRWSV